MNLFTPFTGSLAAPFTSSAIVDATDSVVADATHSVVMGANFFTSFNNLVAQAQTALNGLIIFLGVVIFLIGAARGKWTLPAILLAALAGGLFIWGGISGVQWAADSAGSTIK